MPNVECQNSNEAKAALNFKGQIIVLDFVLVEFGFHLTFEP
jgi:nicotinate-nucleotide pyrophosphorylase